MLRCIACGARADESAYACPECRGALDLEKRPEPALTREDFRGRGVWRFHKALPVPRERAVSLGEGSTPLVRAPELGARLKFEFLNPTGSFKDRGTTTMVSKALELGATHLVEDSSGNAGTSVAAYAARAGVPCTIFTPEWALEAKTRAVRATGADLRKIGGPRQGVTDATFAFCEENGAYYASHAFTPWFVEGTKTLAYELFEDYGWEVPPAVVCPASMGTVLLGLRRGFRELKAAGLTDREPPLYAVNAAGIQPLVDAVHGASDARSAERTEVNRFADGILIPEPPRLSELVEAVTGSGGDVVAVTEAETRDALGDLHRRGVLVEPTSAVAVAGLRRFRDRGGFPEGEPALVLTGRFK